MKSLDLVHLKQKLAHFQGKYEIIVYGSQVEGGAKSDSDVDIAILTRNRNIEENLWFQKEILGILTPFKYDLRVFELLPIQVQYSIIQNYEVVYGDPLEISEYFYYFRKIWNDSKHRFLSNLYSNHSEQLELMKKYQSA